MKGAGGEGLYARAFRRSLLQDREIREPQHRHRSPRQSLRFIEEDIQTGHSVVFIAPVLS